MTAYLRPGLTLFAMLTLMTGVLYPLSVTALAQLFLPSQANGSLVRDAAGELRGSALVAQPATGDGWFQPRPSAGDYATVASAASNLAPSNPALAERVAASAAALGGTAPVPLELVTTSGSGLDPHLSPAAARWQVPRIAKARGLDAEALYRLIEAATRQPLVGPPVVNVLALNLALAENRTLTPDETRR